MDMVTGALARLFDFLPEALEAALAIIAAASALTALTPTPKDDAALSKLRRLLELLALNVGHARPRR